MYIISFRDDEYRGFFAHYFMKNVTARVTIGVRAYQGGLPGGSSWKRKKEAKRGLLGNIFHEVMRYLQKLNSVGKWLLSDTIWREERDWKNYHMGNSLALILKQ